MSTSRKFKTFLAIAVVAFVAGATNDAIAQTYPSRPVRLVVPTGPGGPLDILGRIIAQKLSEVWGQPMLVDNKPGAALMIGAEAVARAEPDGYTLLLCNDGPISINPSLFRKMPYDPAKDFAPVSQLTPLPLVLVVHPSVPVNSVGELTALAKAKPGTLNVAAGGSTSRFGGELFKHMTGTQIVHVPYKGSGPALTALLGGEVQMLFDGVPSSMAHIRSGRLRALAVTGSKRLASLPELPTMAEAGVPGYETGTWLGVFAPAKTPRPVITMLHADMARVMELPDVRARVAELGMEVVVSTPEQFAKVVQSETVKWAKLVREAGIPPDDQ